MKEEPVPIKTAPTWGTEPVLLFNQHINNENSTAMDSGLSRTFRHLSRGTNIRFFKIETTTDLMKINKL
jgi:hypothetical protein